MPGVLLTWMAITCRRIMRSAQEIFAWCRGKEKLMEGIDEMRISPTYLIAVLLVLLLGLVIALAADPYIRKKQNSKLLLVIFLTATLIMQGYFEGLLAVGPEKNDFRTALAVYGYCIRPTLLILFYDVLQGKNRDRFVWVLTGVNTAVYLTAFFSGIAFRITEDNTFKRGPLGFTCHVVTGVLLAYYLYISFREYQGERRMENLLPVFNTILIVAAVILDSIVLTEGPKSVSTLSCCIVCSCVFYYIWVHLQFAAAHDEDLKARQRIQIMMSQIQPHFLYNTLSTIQALCDIDPKKASEVTEKFAVYLRQNIDFLDRGDLISFEKEMEHTMIYAGIEQVRFPNITISRNIEDDGFQLPALTIQPLVENAIRHGVRIRKKGIVEIVSKQIPGFHEIVISDNGKGFEPEELEKASGTHIGIRNVRERVEQMCGGTLTIESKADAGTTVTIRIPIRQNRSIAGV